MPQTLTLPHETAITLYPCAPFHFDGTVYKPSYFPGPDLRYQPGQIWHTLRFEDTLFGVRMDNLGEVEAPALRLVIFSAAPLAEDQAERITAEMAWRYDLFADLGDFYNTYTNDAALAPVLAPALAQGLLAD